MNKVVVSAAHLDSICAKQLRAIKGNKGRVLLKM